MLKFNLYIPRVDIVACLREKVTIICFECTSPFVLVLTVIYYIGEWKNDSYRWRQNVNNFAKSGLKADYIMIITGAKGKYEKYPNLKEFRSHVYFHAK